MNTITEWVNLKCLSPQQTCPLYLFSESVSNIKCSIENLFIENSTFLFALKDRKSGHNLIHNREMRGNRFDTGLTLTTSLHYDSYLKTAMQSNL